MQVDVKREALHAAGLREYRGDDAESRLLEIKFVTDFHGVRSDIRSDRKRKGSVERYQGRSARGSTSQRGRCSSSLDERPPDGWDRLVVVGE